jgi:hypothetical protein
MGMGRKLLAITFGLLSLICEAGACSWEVKVTAPDGEIKLYSPGASFKVSQSDVSCVVGLIEDITKEINSLASDTKLSERVAITCSFEDGHQVNTNATRARLMDNTDYKVPAVIFLSQASKIPAVTKILLACR